MIPLFLKMVVFHCLCDYPLQGDFLARAKNHRLGIEGVPWLHALVAHSVIQGGAVWYLTGRAYLGLAEMVAHAAIDYLKSDDRISFNQDQGLHILCKAAWVIIFVIIQFWS